MRILLVLSIALITVSGYKTFAHEVPGDVEFVLDYASTVFKLEKASMRKLTSISEIKFSQGMAQLVDSISVVNNVRAGGSQTILFDAVGVDGKLHNNIECFMKYFSKQIGDCNYKVISFLDCGNNEVVFQNNSIAIFSSRISGHSHYVSPQTPLMMKAPCPEPPLRVENSREILM